MGSVDSQPPQVLDRLLAAINAHELDAMVSCFAEDYTNETPVHPPRGFRGQEQVRTNWSQIFAAVPNLQARVVRSSVDGDTLWTEWDIAGDRVDGARFVMRGIVIFGGRGRQDRVGPLLSGAGRGHQRRRQRPHPPGDGNEWHRQGRGIIVILVVGATGNLGGSIARVLLAEGKRVRILVRPGSSYGELVDVGAEPVTGDLKEPASLHAACAGVDAVVTTANAIGRGARTQSNPSTFTATST